MGGSAPDPDPNIGKAALRTAAIGEDHLEWMKGQSEITNQWAADDRARYKDVYEPLQDDFIEEAAGYDTPARRRMEETRAVSDVSQQAAIARAGNDRQMMAQGIDPRSGRYNSMRQQSATEEGLAKSGARNLARQRVEATGRDLRASAVNMGSGFAVNPATSIGISNGGMAQGANAAMSGNRAMGNLLSQDHQNRMSTWSANQAQSAGIFGALGRVAGALPWASIFSSKDAKTDKKPAPGILEALKEVPVESWKYKDGMGDGGGKQHIGPYAEDFQKATGLGNGKEIGVIDIVGINLGAVKELDAKVDDLANRIGKAA